MSTWRWLAGLTVVVELRLIRDLAWYARCDPDGARWTNVACAAAASCSTVLLSLLVRFPVREAPTAALVWAFLSVPRVVIRERPLPLPRLSASFAVHRTKWAGSERLTWNHEQEALSPGLERCLGMA